MMSERIPTTNIEGSNELVSKLVPATHTTATTGNGVVGVGGVVAAPFKWDSRATPAENCRAVGVALAAAQPNLVVTDQALLLIEKGRPRPIDSAVKLSPLLIDTLNLR